MEQTQKTVVNALLKVIGESPVNAIDLGHPDVVTAISIWDEYSMEIQSNAWWYNLETWELAAQTDGTVVIASNVIAIDGPGTYYVKRGGFLYDLENHSYDFSGATASDLELALIMEWTVDDLPAVMFNYILARCKLAMLVDLAYDKNKEAKLEKEVEVRRFLCMKHHLRFGGPNALNSGNASALLTPQNTARS